MNLDQSEASESSETPIQVKFNDFNFTHLFLLDKPRGYAFVEYEHVADMKDAYKHADGTKIDGRRVLVDVERGRTMEGWCDYFHSFEVHFVCLGDPRD